MMLTLDENSFPRITIRVRNVISYRAAVPFDVSSILAAYLSPPLLATHFSFHFVLFLPVLLLSAHSITLSFFILAISESVFRCITLSSYIIWRKMRTIFREIRFRRFFFIRSDKNKNITCHFIMIQIILIRNMDLVYFLRVFFPLFFYFSLSSPFFILIILFFIFS